MSNSVLIIELINIITTVLIHNYQSKPVVSPLLLGCRCVVVAVGLLYFDFRDIASIWTMASNSYNSPVYETLTNARSSLSSELDDLYQYLPGHFLEEFGHDIVQKAIGKS